METLFGNNPLILFFIVGLTIICYGNFKHQQKVMMMYLVTYVVCILDLLSTSIAIVALTILIFVYLEYLTEDSVKIKIFKKFRYKICDATFLAIFQYYYIVFVLALAFQTQLIIKVFDNQYYHFFCMFISLICIVICIHKTSVGIFELETITDVMRKIEKHPVYRFEYRDEDMYKYNILTNLEDKTYFIRENSYNFVSVEFIKYKLENIYRRLKGKRLKTKMKTTWKLTKRYVKATKHIRGYSTLEMQLIRNIALKNGYNLIVRRKIFEIVYTKIFFSGLKEYYIDNYYNNRQHYKEYLLWLYLHTVQTSVNDKKIRPFHKAFKNDFKQWSYEGLFVAVMGLSYKKPERYYEEPFCSVAESFYIDIKKATKMYYEYDGEAKLK